MTTSSSSSSSFLHEAHPQFQLQKDTRAARAERSTFTPDIQVASSRSFVIFSSRENLQKASHSVSSSSSLPALRPALPPASSPPKETSFSSFPELVGRIKMKIAETFSSAPNIPERPLSPRPSDMAVDENDINQHATEQLRKAMQDAGFDYEF